VYMVTHDNSPNKIFRQHDISPKWHFANMTIPQLTINLQSVQYNYRAGSDYIGECLGLEPAILPESWRWAAVSDLVSSIGLRIRMFPLFFTGGHNAAPESHPYVLKRSNPSSHPTALASQVAWITGESQISRPSYNSPTNNSPTWHFTHMTFHTAEVGALVR
jgi:hypothetical protein